MNKANASDIGTGSWAMAHDAGGVVIALMHEVLLSQRFMLLKAGSSPRMRQHTVTVAW